MVLHDQLWVIWHQATCEFRHELVGMLGIFMWLDFPVYLCIFSGSFYDLPKVRIRLYNSSRVPCCKSMKDEGCFVNNVTLAEL